MRRLSKIKVYIADDHQIVRKGIIRLLQSFERIGEIKEAQNGRELIRMIQESLPDLVLLDIRMPVMDGVETCKFLESKYPKVKIIMLTMEDNDMYVDLMMGLGAHGFLTKDSSPDEVEKAIYSVVDHDFYYNDVVLRALRQGVKNRKKVERGNILDKTIHLTDREIEIIRLTCGERTMRQIAKELSISERTVQNHRANILSKIGVNNIAGLVKYAIQKEIYSLSDEKSR